MTTRNAALMLTAGLTLTACNLAPKYVRPELPVPATSPVGPSYRTGGDAAAIVPADTAWYSFFTDDRLRRVIRTTLDNNRDLRVAVVNVEQARALYRVQRADLFPTVGVSGSATYQETLSGSNGTATGVVSPGAGTGTGVGAGTGTGVGTGVGTGTGVTTGAAGASGETYALTAGVSAWEVDLFGRVRNLSRAAQQQYFAAAENRNAAQTALIAEAATAWLTLAADRERLRIARETAIAFRSTLTLTEARFRVGISSELEVRQARTSYDQARSDITEATTLVAQDENALNLLAGTTLGADVLPAQLPTAGATLDSLPSNLPSEVLLRRPDIAAAEHQLIAANANIGAARAAFFPTISLTAALGTISTGLSSLFSAGSTFFSAGPSAALPIFDFGRTRGNLAYAEATRNALLAAYERSVQSAFREVADALARRGTIDAQLEARTSLRDNARGAFRLSELRFRAGIDPFLNTLDAQRTLYAAEQGLLATRLTRVANAVELYRSLGGGLR